MRIEQQILSNLIYNEHYCRKVIPFLKKEYFSDRKESVVVTQIIETGNVDYPKTNYVSATNSLLVYNTLKANIPFIQAETIACVVAKRVHSLSTLLSFVVVKPFKRATAS